MFNVLSWPFQIPFFIFLPFQPVFFLFNLNTTCRLSFNNHSLPRLAQMYSYSRFIGWFTFKSSIFCIISSIQRCVQGRKKSMHLQWVLWHLENLFANFSRHCVYLSKSNWWHYDGPNWIKVKPIALVIALNRCIASMSLGNLFDFCYDQTHCCTFLFISILYASFAHNLLVWCHGVFVFVSILFQL